ncbi:hypothetical protein BGZ73_002043, partial [Actinomortierella ambigua]
MVKRFNETHLLTDFAPGSYVMVTDPLVSGAFGERYEGPFKVCRRTTHGAYVLKDGDKLLPRNYAPEQLKLVSVEEEGEYVEGGKYFTIEAILQHAYDADSGQWKYLVKWKGYDASANTWEFPRAFRSMEPIHKYYRRIKQPVPDAVALEIEAQANSSGEDEEEDQEATTSD